ncbi:MAG: hypothetical protein ACI9YU_001037 [Flavobacteriales bacterium]
MVSYDLVSIDERTFKNLMMKFPQLSFFAVLAFLAMTLLNTGCGDGDQNPKSTIDQTNSTSIEESSSKAEANATDSNRTLLLKEAGVEYDELNLDETRAAFQKLNLGMKDNAVKGDHNITIDFVSVNEVWLEINKVTVTAPHKYKKVGCKEISYKKVTHTERIDRFNIALDGVHVQLWFKEDGKSFDYKTVSATDFNGGTKASLGIKKDFDAKLIPEFNVNTGTSFVGGQDIRGITGSKTDYIYVDLEYQPIRRKRMRVWYADEALHVSGNMYTKVVKTKLNTCDINFKHWGKKLNVNPLKDASNCPKCFPDPKE